MKAAPRARPSVERLRAVTPRQTNGDRLLEQDQLVETFGKERACPIWVRFFFHPTYLVQCILSLSWTNARPSSVLTPPCGMFRTHPPRSHRRHAFAGGVFFFSSTLALPSRSLPSSFAARRNQPSLSLVLFAVHALHVKTITMEDRRRSKRLNRNSRNQPHNDSKFAVRAMSTRD